MNKRYDTTLARIAGNIASGILSGKRDLMGCELSDEAIAQISVDLAKEIVKRCPPLSEQERGLRS